MSLEKDFSTDKYSVNLGRWTWRFRLVPTLLLVLLLPLCLYLSHWQYTKALAKQQMMVEIKAYSDKDPLDFNRVANPSLEKLLYTPVLLRGIYVHDYTFLLDNQVLRGVAGYRVLTVLQLPGIDRWVLVDRGWIPAGRQRSVLPDIEFRYGMQYLEGVIHNINAGVVLTSDVVVDEPQWPLVIQSVDYEFLEKQLQHDLHHFVVKLVSKADTNYEVIPLEYGLNSSRNFGYAVQWILFAILLCVYYVVVSVHRNK